MIVVAHVRACRPSGAVRHTNRLYLGPKCLIQPLGRLAEKDRERAGKILKVVEILFMSWREPLTGGPATRPHHLDEVAVLGAARAGRDSDALGGRRACLGRQRKQTQTTGARPASGPTI